jgi:peroxiredoxin
MTMKTLVFSALMVFATGSFAEVKVDAPAPDFSVKDASGKVQALKDLKGKWVVLEWYNKDCPFVKKHYGSKNMQALQKDYTAKGVSWLTVISSAKGKQGYLEPKEAIKNAKKVASAATAVLIDSDGKMGKAYDASTTPHMFVINPEGNVVYAGAIDDNDSSDPATIKGAKNFVREALDAQMPPEKREVAVKSHPPYGCSIKYN